MVSVAGTPDYKLGIRVDGGVGQTSPRADVRSASTELPMHQRLLLPLFGLRHTYTGWFCMNPEFSKQGIDHGRRQVWIDLFKPNTLPVSL